MATMATQPIDVDKGPSDSVRKFSDASVVSVDKDTTNVAPSVTQESLRQRQITKLLQSTVLVLEAFTCYIVWEANTELLSEVAAFTALDGGAATWLASLVLVLPAVAVCFAGWDVVAKRFLSRWFYLARGGASITLLFTMIETHAVRVVFLAVSVSVFWATQISVIQNSAHKERHKWGLMFGLYCMTIVKFLFHSNDVRIPF